MKTVPLCRSKGGLMFNVNTGLRSSVLLSTTWLSTLTGTHIQETLRLGFYPNLYTPKMTSFLDTFFYTPSEQSYPLTGLTQHSDCDSLHLSLLSNPPSRDLTLRRVPSKFFPEPLRIWVSFGNPLRVQRVFLGGRIGTTRVCGWISTDTLHVGV